METVVVNNATLFSGLVKGVVLTQLGLRLAEGRVALDQARRAEARARGDAARGRATDVRAAIEREVERLGIAIDVLRGEVERQLDLDLSGLGRAMALLEQDKKEQ